MRPAMLFALAASAAALSSPSIAQQVGSATARIAPPPSSPVIDNAKQREALLRRLRELCLSHAERDRKTCRDAQAVIERARPALDQ